MAARTGTLPAQAYYATRRGTSTAPAFFGFLATHLASRGLYALRRTRLSAARGRSECAWRWAQPENT
jgi:hypothetical protein